MADVYCTVGNCGEPWDLDSIHDEAESRDMTFDEALQDFRLEGCVFLGSTHTGAAAPDDVAMMREVYDLFGTDIDGAISTIEDWLG